MTAIPIVLLTGWVGAGKTSALNHLLAAPEMQARRPAVIVNEFGALGVDGKLLREGDYVSFEINKGSLFCVCTKVDFVTTLETIARDVRPGVVLIEATGVAETGDIERFCVEPYLEGRFEIAANVCVVDAANFTKIAPYLKSARSQVRWADGLAINKTDLVGPGQLASLEAALAEMNPDAARVHVRDGAVDVAFVDSLRHIERTGEPIDAPPADIVAASIRHEGPISRAAFDAAVASLGPRLLRLKGDIDFGAGPRFVEYAGDALTERPAAAGLGAPVAFTAIAHGLTCDELTALFENPPTA